MGLMDLEECVWFFTKIEMFKGIWLDVLVHMSPPIKQLIPDQKFRITQVSIKQIISDLNLFFRGFNIRVLLSGIHQVRVYSRLR